MLVVATLFLCAIWIALFFREGVVDVGGLAVPGVGIVRYVYGASALRNLLIELGATMLAALAVGFWTAGVRVSTYLAWLCLTTHAQFPWVIHTLVRKC